MYQLYYCNFIIHYITLRCPGQCFSSHSSHQIWKGEEKSLVRERQQGSSRETLFDFSFSLGTLQFESVAGMGTQFWNIGQTTRTHVTAFMVLWKKKSTLTWIIGHW